MQSEGSVCSHTRRALLAGATPEEIHHTLLLLVSTIGFPQAMAAFSWVEEVTKKSDMNQIACGLHKCSASGDKPPHESHLYCIADFFSSQTRSVEVEQNFASKLSLVGLHSSYGLCELDPQFKHVNFMAIYLL